MYYVNLGIYNIKCQILNDLKRLRYLKIKRERLNMSRQDTSTFSIGSLVLTPKQDEFCYYEGIKKSI